MSQFISDLQYKIKTSSGSILLLVSKLFMGFVLGLTFAMIGQQMIGYGTFSFLLVITAALTAFYKVARGWKWSHLAVFTLIFALIGVLLRMYIMVAPGA